MAEKKTVIGGDYVVKEQIATGSVGATFVVMDRLARTELVLKCLRPLEEQTPAAKASLERHKRRFAREVQAMITLDHPSIVRIYDCDLDNENPYYVMEFCRNGSLQQVIESGVMSSTKALKTLWPICSALQYAHSRGVLHRDIKPANILFDSEGRAKVSDFGMCRIADWHSLTHGDDSMLGTLYYLPPEQAQDPRSVDVRSDIFSLGRTIRHMLVGSPIGTALPSSSSTQRRRRDQLKPWDRVISEMTSLARTRRPRSMRAVGSLLDRIGKKLPIGAYAREQRKSLLGAKGEEPCESLRITPDDLSQVVALVGLGTPFSPFPHGRGYGALRPKEFAHLKSIFERRAPLAAFMLSALAHPKGLHRKYSSKRRLLLDAQRAALLILGVDAAKRIREFARFASRW